MSSDEQAIANVLARYAESIDGADFAGLGLLFEEGQIRFDGSDDVVVGREAVAAMYAGLVQVHDGSPLTKHVMTNSWVEIDDGGSSARSRSYFTVFQAHPELPLQPVAAGRYADTFRKADGSWRFAERIIIRDLVGDLRFHLRHDPYEEPGE